MILRRLNQTETALKVLDKIGTEMPVIENQSYHQATLLYKGTIQIEDLLKAEGMEGASNDALDYGIANWYFYNKDKAKAKEMLQHILQ